MAKFTDAVRNTLTGYFNIGDQPTEAQFAALILAIQEGIEEHDHDDTGDGDGKADLGITSLTGAGIDVPNNWYLGIGAGLERIVLSTANAVSVLGAFFGVGDATPGYKLDVYEDRADSYAAHFRNDGDNINRHGISVQCGADDPATVGTTYFFAALDGDADMTGGLRSVNGVFALVDFSDISRKTNIVDTKVNGLDIVNGLRVRDFNWKSNPKGPAMTSFIAQEAQKVYPAMVGPLGENMLGTARAILIPVLTKAIQELDVRLTAGGL